MALTDTPPEIQKILIQGYRKMSPLDKMRRVSELNRSIQQMALARIRREYGDITEDEEKLRLASLWLDKNLMIKAFGWNPQQEGY